jgi:nucleoside-diphosphate-sugar epimerase
MVIQADMKDIALYRQALDEVDCAILAAACWGGKYAFPVNVEANLAVAEALAAKPGRRVLYFATASVLDRQSHLLTAAKEAGTEYIRSKHRLVESMEKLSPRLDVVGLFPTLVLGGDGVRPSSHLARLAKEAAPWVRLLSFLKADGRFHFIHAEDIARVVRAVIESPPETAPRRIVLGNPASSVDEILRQFCGHFGIKAPFRVPLRLWMVNPLLRLCRVRLTAWDRYCMDHPDQSYAGAVNSAAYGLPVYCPNLATGLAQIGLLTGRR